MGKGGDFSKVHKGKKPRKVSTMTNKMLFRHYSKTSSDYETLALQIALEEDPYRQSNPETARILSLHWQRTLADKEGGWYGFSMEIDTRSGTDLDHVYSIVRRLRGRDALDLDCYVSPQDVLERLRALRAIECVYDPRESEWVEIEHVAPADFVAWRDDWKTAGYDGCTVGCLAPNETDARKGILSEFARLSADTYRTGYDGRLAAWIVAGKPVIRVSSFSLYHDAPDTTPLDARIAA